MKPLNTNETTNIARPQPPQLNGLTPASRAPSQLIGRELSVMAWIEDAFGHVLLVKQKAGRKAWSFPGGKVRQGETLIHALKRELQEEIGVTVDVATPIDIFDRTEKSNLTILFRVILKPQNEPLKHDNEIEKFAFRRSAPRLSTPSLRFFWRRAQKTFDPLASF